MNHKTPHRDDQGSGRERACDSLDKFLSGDLPADQETEFSRHLASCADCTRQVDLDRALDRWLIDGNAETEVPPSLLASVQTELKAETNRRRLRTASALLSIAAAIAVMIGLAVANLGRDALIQVSTDPSSPATQTRPSLPAAEPIETVGMTNDEIVVRGGAGFLAAEDSVEGEDFVLFWVLPSQPPVADTPSTDDESSHQPRVQPLAERASNNPSVNIRKI